MDTLLFPSTEALRVALTSGLVPPDVQRSRARFAFLEGGAIAICPHRGLDPTEQARLEELGVRSADVALESEARCWAEVLPARRSRQEAAVRGPVLFVAPADARPMLELCGEMMRRGCDRQQLRVVRRPSESLALVKAVDPPYYTVLQAMDRVGGLRAFAPGPPGQERLWIELGYTHPLARTLEPAPGTMVLVAGEGGWLFLDEGRWTDVYQLLDLELPDAANWTAESPRARIPVRLRLARAVRPEPPSLWVIRRDAVRQLEEWVSDAPETLIHRLSFAVTSGPEPIVILRARPSREGPPALELDAEALAPVAQIPNLYAPAEHVLEPPLRRDRLRELLAPDPDQTFWLTASPDGRLRRESIAESAFHSLSDWVEYVVDRASPALEGWIRGVTFDVEPFEIAQDEDADRSTEPEQVTEPSRIRTTAPAHSEPPQEQRAEPPPAAEPIPLLAPLRPVEEGHAERALAERERRFLLIDGPADAPERAALWGEMGELNAQLGRLTDAALCFTRALWDATGDAAVELARRWEAAMTSGDESSLADRLARESPGPDGARVVAAMVVRSALEGQLDAAVAHAAQLWLDRHDDALDVRSAWLARWALSLVTGGDALGLARARDRVLARLCRGLSMERDVPRFLRFSASREREGGSARRLSAQLDALLDRFERTPRRRSVVEAAPLQYTMAYVHLVFAYGLARLGTAERARVLREHAMAAVDGTDPLHAFLVDAFSARVDQALEGLPPDTPLSPELNARLDGADKLLRFKADRLRQASAILDPQQLDAFEALAAGDARGFEFAALRGLADAGELAARLGQLSSRACDASLLADERLRLLDGLLDFLPALPESAAMPMLQQCVQQLAELPGPGRLRLIEEALAVAAHFDRVELVRDLSTALHRAFAELDVERLQKAAGALSTCIRVLKRVGFRDQAALLLDAVAKVARGSEPRALIARLHMAGGFAYLGRLEQASGIFEEGFESLQRWTGQPPVPTKLMRALANALSYAPIGEALAGLERLSRMWPLITDNYTVSTSHCCLSVLEFCDLLVLGHASDELVGDVGRRYVEDDEYLVRRRIHRDLSA